MAGVGARRSTVGVGLVVLGLLVSPWTIGLLATDDGSINRDDFFALLLLVSGISILGGLQLLFGWVERLSWGRPVGLVRVDALIWQARFGQGDDATTQTRQRHDHDPQAV